MKKGNPQKKTQLIDPTTLTTAPTEQTKSIEPN
jgi:hypothetical protein